MALKNTSTITKSEAGSTDWQFPTQKQALKQMLLEIIIISGSARVDVTCAPVSDIVAGNPNAVAVPWSAGNVEVNTQKVSPKFNAYRLTIISGEAHLNVKLL